jgi:glycosyltransferase involved in cell wall biosynthesis
MKTKKIAIIHYTTPPVIAGVELVIKDHTDLLLKDGYQVKIISGKGNKFRKDIEFAQISEINPRNERYLRMRAKFEQGKNDSHFNEYKNCLKIKLQKELKDVDICIIHQALTMHFNFALTESLIEIIEENTRINFIHWTHDATFLDKNYTKKFLKYKNLSPWKLIYKMHLKIKYVSITEFRKKQFARLFSVSPNKITNIPNGVIIENLFVLNESYEKLISDLDILNCDLVACLPTRIVRRKNIEKAIEIIAELKKSYPKIKYIITGARDFQNPDSIDYFNDLIKLSKKLGVDKDVVFLSELKLSNGKKINLEDIQVLNLYLLSDFLLIPSYMEGFGLQLIESGLTKTPIVCSDILPFREITKNDALSFNLKENPKIIAERIIKYMNDHPSSRLRSRVMREFILEKIYKEKIKPLLRTKNEK